MHFQTHEKTPRRLICVLLCVQNVPPIARKR